MMSYFSRRSAKTEVGKADLESAIEGISFFIYYCGLEKRITK